MKAKHISERIRDIKSLIARANFKTAFDQLEQLIREIDGVEIENEQEREFINQLITIRARYNSFTDKIITGTDEAKQEQNQIIQSLLQLTDSIHELLEDNPDLIVPRNDEITANLSIPVTTPSASRPVISDPPPAAHDGASNKGCLLSLSKSGDQTSVNLQANWMRFFIGAAIFILALAFGWKMISNSGDTDNPSTGEVVSPPPPPPPPVVLPIDPPEKRSPITAPSSSSTAIKDIAAFLSKFPTNYEAAFRMNEINFKKNSIGLNKRAKEELDDLVDVLEKVPELSFSITASFGQNENPEFKGNKELTLGDARARAVFQYLKAKGIPVTRMEFEGSGVKDRGIVEIRMDSRMNRK